MLGGELIPRIASGMKNPTRKSPFLMGKSTINGQFSIAMLVYRRVTGHFGTSK
jgi:hypothetical protein